jgi:hypothetical protein
MTVYFFENVQRRPAISSENGLQIPSFAAVMAVTGIENPAAIAVRAITTNGDITITRIHKLEYALRGIKAICAAAVLVTLFGCAMRGSQPSFHPRPSHGQQPPRDDRHEHPRKMMTPWSSAIG